MVRPRAFDEAAVMNSAIRCFWKSGYAATSVRDLEAETGLKMASLYNAFGDKRSIFRLSLERYVDAHVGDRIRRLESGLPGKARIHAFIQEVIDRSLSDPERKGCLLINSAIEVAPHDPELGAFIADCLADIQGFFRRALDLAARDGELPASICAEDISKALMAMVFGLRVLARACPERALLEGAARPLLVLLDGRAAPTAPPLPAGSAA